MRVNSQALLGRVLDGRYRLVEFLGEGAYGRVYAAEELVLDELIATCALKVMRPRDRDHARSILKEFVAAAQLEHAGLVKFRGALEVREGDLAGVLCLAMERCEGTLRDLLKDRLRVGRRLQPDEVLGVARDLAEVLVWLHGQRVAHLDVKPENLLRVGDHWKLGDLGQVRVVEGTLDQTETPRGTPLYRAPETMKKLVGPSVDIWALGVLLQECLTGILAYNATSVEGLFGALLTEAPTIAPDLPPPFDAVVRGCLVKDPGERWTAAQVLAAVSPSSAPASGSRSEVVAPAVPPLAPRGLVAMGRNWPGLERFQVDRLGSVLVSLPAGRFTMGSPEGEEGRAGDEVQHEVVLSRGFLLGEVPVTQAEYQAVVGANPSHFSGHPDRPVEQVSWLDAVRFCNALSRGLGLEEAYVVDGEEVTWKGLSCSGFRLPTEAEWEYACRAGTTGARYGNLGDVAWYDGNSGYGGNLGKETHAVRGKQPNAWGLYDMLGNVWEWCWDWWSSFPQGVVTDPVGPASGSRRVSRGGSCYYDALYARAASRFSYDPVNRYDDLGFRLARSLP